MMRILLALALCAATSHAHPARPNIVLILSDDLGYADIGVHGSKDIPTPNIDAMAARGVRFTDAYANGSVCTPTRAALMSGRYQNRLGMEGLANVTGPLPTSVRTLADRLRAAGYTTAMIGKWHLGNEPGYTPLDRGFEEFFGFLDASHAYLPTAAVWGTAKPILRNRALVEEPRYLTDAFGEEAAAFITRRRDGAKPFFLYLAFNAVHTPMTAIPKYRKRFPAITVANRRTYAAMLSAMDDAIGRVVAALKETDALDRTLLIFTNDNGGPTTRNSVNGARNTPLRGSKGETFEGGIRVPLLMQWPGVLNPGSVYRQPCITFDLTATILAAAGADTKGVEGVNLLPYLTGGATGAPHDALFWRGAGNHAVRQGDWKLVYSTEGKERTPARDMLFHLATDVGEQHDVAADEPERLLELKKRYEAWSAEVDADSRTLGDGPPAP